jgi:hypothetical protein
MASYRYFFDMYDDIGFENFRKYRCFEKTYLVGSEPRHPHQYRLVLTLRRPETEKETHTKYYRYALTNKPQGHWYRELLSSAARPSTGAARRGIQTCGGYQIEMRSCTQSEKMWEYWASETLMLLG